MDYANSRMFMVAILACNAGLVSWIAFKNTPNSNEASHLATGVYNWQHGRFDLYPVNPPLVRMIAALPVVLASPAVDLEAYRADNWKPKAAARPEWSMGIGFGSGSSVDFNLIILNAFNARNILNVYRFTGLPDDDGYLASDVGQQDILVQIDPTAFNDLYNLSTKRPGYISRPRSIRLGMSISF